MIKITTETNMTITEIEKMILKASINNRTTNTMNILGISEDLWYLIQSNMKDRMYQIQTMLADELDIYSRQRNQYVNDNIREIQDLYKDRKQKKESNKWRVEDKEVILIKPYKVFKSTSSMMKSKIWWSTWNSSTPLHKWDYLNHPTLPITLIQRRTRFWFLERSSNYIGG